MAHNDVKSWRDYFTKVAERYVPPKKPRKKLPETSTHPSNVLGTNPTSNTITSSLATLAALVDGSGVLKLAAMPQVPVGSLNAPLPSAGQRQAPQPAALPTQPGQNAVMGNPNPLGTPGITQAPTTNPVADATGASTVGPGNSPSVNPIGSYGPLGASPGTVTGNSAFGQQHNKTGICRDLLVKVSSGDMLAFKAWKATGLSDEEADRKAGESLALPGDKRPVGKARYITRAELQGMPKGRVKTVSLGNGFNRSTVEKEARVEPMPRWKNPPSSPISFDKVQQNTFQQLAKSLGMAFDENGELYDTFAVNKNSAAHGIDGEGGYWAKTGERCQHCFALHERGDDGKCNSCGKEHDHPAYKQGSFKVAGCLSVDDARAAGRKAKAEHVTRRFHYELKQALGQNTPEDDASWAAYQDKLHNAGVATLLKTAMDDWHASGGNQAAFDQTLWERKLRRLWERRDPLGIEQGNPYAALFRAQAAELRLNAATGRPDIVAGGQSDGKPDTGFAPGQLRTGLKHEQEHTLNPAAAHEIAKDHLVEDPKYYTHLEQVEKAADLLSHPATPFVLKPLLGAGVSLGINELVRRIAEMQSGAKYSPEELRRDRIMAGGMGAGLGLGRAAAPYIEKAVFGG